LAREAFCLARVLGRHLRIGVPSAMLHLDGIDARDDRPRDPGRPHVVPSDRLERGAALLKQIVARHTSATKPAAKRARHRAFARHFEYAALALRLRMHRAQERQQIRMDRNTALDTGLCILRLLGATIPSVMHEDRLVL
jgi:hypothetical protein